MKLIKGKDLNQAQVVEVLSAYVHRWTTGNEHRERLYGLCPHCEVLGGEPSEDNVACRQRHPTVPLQTDAQWLDDYAFYFTNAGVLSHRMKYCVPAYMTD